VSNGSCSCCQGSDLTVEFIPESFEHSDLAQAVKKA